MSEDEDENKKKKRKSKKKSELKEILEMLEMIYSKLASIERTNSSEVFAGRMARLNPKHSISYERSYSKPEVKQAKSESTSYGKITKEPEVQVKERVVYDQELRNMMENIRKRLDELLPQKGEEDEKVKITETLEKIEDEFVGQESEGAETEEEAENKVEEQSYENEQEAEVEPEEGKQANESKTEQAEESVEQAEEKEPLPIIEDEKLEDVKAQEEVKPEIDDSISGEFLGEEPEEEYIPKTREELRELREEIDDPVFWQNVENEIIEEEFKKPEPRPKPEVDEYGY